MEHYYLWAVICCFLPFIIGALVFAVHDDEVEKHPNHSVPATSPVFRGVEDMMLKEYYYDTILHNRLRTKLRKVNLYDPKTRSADIWDVWFKKFTQELCHDGYCLAYIDHYGHLTDTFFKNLVELDLKPEHDITFQKLLVSEYKISGGLFAGVYRRNYTNLLFIYGQRWQLLPEIVDILKTDKRFSDARQTYELAREYALEKQEKAKKK